jgi:hypothetical protein
LAKAEAIDTPIGSTALGGAVSTLISMKRTASYRTLQTVQRIGTDLPETVLRFDPATRLLSLGGLREGFEVADVGETILRALADKSMTEPEIDAAIEGKTTVKRRALRELTGNGRIARSGSGKRGDPFRYEKGCSIVPAPIEETRNKKPNEGLPEEPNGDEKKVVPAIRNIDGNKGTSNFPPLERRGNTGDLLVLAKTGVPLNFEKPGTSFSEEVWL